VSLLDRALSALDLPPEWNVRIQIRPRRRTLGIEVAPDGSVLLAVPPDADEQEIIDVLRANLDRVARAVRRRKAAGADHPVKELVEGEHFGYLGRTYRLRLREAMTSGVRLNGGWLELPIKDGLSPVPRPLIEWYATRTEHWCRRHAGALASRAGVTLPPVTIRNLRGRWGERRADGGIALHWAVIQMSAPLVELVLAHELTHLHTARHSPDFRRRLAMLVPGLGETEQQLAREGQQVWLGHVRETTLTAPCS
jgi:predicted metal-dependent hydrolase